MLENGIDENKILDIQEMTGSMRQRTYFDLEAMGHDAKEIFVDIGALDGNTSLLFADWSRDAYKHIYCFEPHHGNALLCEKRLSTIINAGRATVFHKAAWSCAATLNFCDRTQSIDKQGINEVSAVAVDDILSGERVTFIKMDVEGAEEGLSIKWVCQVNHTP